MLKYPKLNNNKNHQFTKIRVTFKFFPPWKKSQPFYLNCTKKTFNLSPGFLSCSEKYRPKTPSFFKNSTPFSSSKSLIIVFKIFGHRFSHLGGKTNGPALDKILMKFIRWVTSLDSFVRFVHWKISDYLALPGDYIYLNRRAKENCPVYLKMTNHRICGVSFLINTPISD